MLECYCNVAVFLYCTFFLFCAEIRQLTNKIALKSTFSAHIHCRMCKKLYLCTAFRLIYVTYRRIEWKNRIIQNISDAYIHYII